ncbi:filamentous hemagglutinin N-terminal domain-containing protein [Pseudoduganella sp. FT55W]|uniref:Filamentous hemagglutinin N-terminal domain-containing protein n=1 Tax=Duganella rivi TaxID=2666083 RepID=A0A7X4K9P1_9BURK|nr:YDG domain-containing protein [Duganella rivi]MYM66186.1 filamentous hemagglutinin N-terminal domain-containing protein [Duganella rivi]
MKATAPSHRRNLRRKAIAVLVAACYSNAYAAPVSPTVVAGQASFNIQGKTYTITNTPNAIINWQGFSIAADELTRFVQQSSDSKVLNRITGQDPSVILGSLQSNGKVFLINPNGVMFGAGSRVDVHGLVASSLNISNADFLAGKNNFDGAAGAGKVSNQGTITTPSGGQIFLIAPAVENSGVISSPNGDVVLAAGHSVQLFDAKDPNVQVVVSSPSDQSLNLGQIVAQGGRIGVYGALIKQRGAINANSAVRGANGKIVLKASGTTLVEADSTTTATGSNLNTGGDILLLGQKVGVAGNAVVDASGESGGGTVLVGGDYQGKNPAVMNAQQAYLSKDAVLRADATDKGNGGKVVVWSDQATQVHGAISARGGAAGGNGGLVETSGHYLDMQGTVDTRAPSGANGSLLLDPSDVYIAVDTSTATTAGWSSSSQLSLNGSQFLETGAVKDSLLLTGVLETALLTTNVTVSTANTSGTGTGTIKVLSPLLWATSRNLSLQADGDISLKSSITGINGTLNLTAGGSIVQVTSPIDALAVSNLNAIAAGDIMFDNNANTIGGTATLASSGGSVKLTAVNVNLGASNAAGTFDVTAYNGDLNINGDISAGSDIALQSSKANGTLTIASGRTVDASGGGISLVADKMSLLGDITGSTYHEVRLTPYQDAVNVLIGGSAADATGTLGLSQSELQHISLPNNSLLSIGTSFTNPSATGNLTVNGALDLTGSLGNGSMLLQTKAGDLTINSGASLATNGIISLQALPSGDHRVTNAGTVTSNVGINIFAGKMTLAGGTLNTGSVSLSTGNQIDLGATGNPANTLALTNADINSVHADHLDISINSVHTGTGDIVQSAPITFGQQSVMLNAQRNIDLQAALNAGDLLQLDAAGAISATGAVAVSGKFELVGGNWVQNSATLPAFSAHDFALTGGSFVRALGGNGLINTPYQLTDVFGLQGAASLNQSNSYVLANDIDASATGYWSNHFVPIAGNGVYTGVFDGANHTISGLTIYRPGEQNVGMFSALDTGTIRNLTLSSVDVQGSSNVGALAGYVTDGVGSIDNVHASGEVRGIGNTGLLIGRNGGLVGFATTSGTVKGLSGYNASNIGGLIGQNVGQVSDSSSSAVITTTGDGYAGGLIGSNAKTGNFIGAVTRSYATGNVSSTGEIVGGLIGDNNGGTLTLSYASGNVNGGRNVGGLAGRNANGSTINNAYATGDVSGNSTANNISHGNIGGLIGDLFAGSVSNVYSKGTVSPSGFFGYHGLVGAVENGSLTHGYFDGTQAGTFSDAAGGVGLTTAQMQQQSSFSGMDFNNTWRIYDGHTEPMLKTFLTPYTVAVTGGASIEKVYDGESAAFTGTTGALPAGIEGDLGFSNAVNAGTYSVGGLYSTKYDISYTGASAQLTITPRTVTAVATTEKTYDGTVYVTDTPHYTFSNLVGSDSLSLSGYVLFNDKHVGIDKPLSISELMLSGNSHGNYTLGSVTGTGTISPAALAISGLSVASRVYDGGVAAPLSGSPSVNPVYGDDVSISLIGSGTATFSNKNVGSGKLVTVNTSGFSLSGSDAGNYVLVSPGDLTGEITPAPLTVNGMTAQSRVYNVDFDPVSHSYGRKATVTGGSLSGVLGSDQVSMASTNATFADKNVGTAKSVTVNGVTLSGTDAGNYTVTTYPQDLTADITPATLTLTLASRQYNNSAAGSFTDAVLTGVLGQGQEVPDNVTLNSGGAIATYADKNVGTAKVVTVSGEPLSLGGYDGGNYVLSTNITGDITARPVATWIGTAPGAWSASGNWADGVAPDAANVLKAELGSSGGLVTYDSAAGNVTLVTLSSSGTPLTLTGGKLTLTGNGSDYSNFGSTLTQNGGGLEVQGRLRASNLVLSSGALKGIGANSEINASALNQSGGGIIDSTGLVTVGGGNVVVGNIRAHQLTIDVGEGGTVSQLSGSQLDVGKVSVSANGNITFNNANNHVNEFEATIYGSGNIGLVNSVGTGELLLGPLTTHGNIIIDNHGAIRTVGAITAHSNGAGSGQISITAHSPVTIGSSLIGTDIGLSASTDIVLGSGALLDSVHSIAMTAGTNIVLGGTLTVGSGGSISAVATTGNISTSAGTHINSNGSPLTLSAPQGSVNTTGTAFGTGTVPIISDGAAQAAADAAAKAAADAAAKAAADAAAKAAADAAAKAAADAAAKAAADAAAKAAADAAADAAAKAAADAAAKAAAKAAADAAAKAAADAAAAAAAKAAADAAAKAAADAAAKAAADAAAQGQQTQPVTQAINSTVNIINSSVNSSQNKSGTQTVPEQKIVSTGGSSSGNSAPDEKVPDEKNADGSSKTTTTAAKEQTKKMYCN